eukprot:PhF_6_TR38885/c0_g1_i1/m.58160/K04798/pfdB, PFDN6; prefoldin beta subunit
MDALNKEMQDYNEQVRTLRDKRQKLVSQRHQLTAQQTENTLVKKELTELEPGATVYKLIGPVLVSQDLSDANAVIEKRLEYLNGEVKRVDAAIKESEKKEDEFFGKMQDIQRQAQELAKKAQAAAGAN